MPPSEPGSLISVILPNYNHARYLRDTIRSLANQNPPPQEIIVIDDASTDDSLAVLSDLATEFPSLRVLREDTNRGAIAALNRGLAEARGAYLYFGAADDLALPGLFAAMTGALRRYPEAAFAACECIITDFSGRRAGFRPPIRPSYREKFFSPRQVERLLRRADNWALTGAAVFRSDVVRAAGGFDDTAASFADGLLVRHLALRSGFIFVPVIGFNWRINPKGLSRSASSGVDASNQMLSSMLGHIETDPVFPPWYAPLLKRRWRFNVGRIATVESRPMRADLLLACCSHNGFDRTIYRLASVIWHPAGVFLALVWLTLRERPMSLMGIVLTALSRRFSSPHG